MGHAQCRKRLLQRSAAFQRSHSHACGSRAGSGNGTRIEHSLEEEGHQGGPSSRQRVRILQPYFIVPWKDGGLRPILGLSQLNHSVMQLKFRILSSSWSYLRPDPRTGCQERSRRRILPISILPHHRKFFRCALGSKHINIEYFPSALHSHLHSCTFTMCGYCAGSSVTPGHLHTRPHRWWLILAHQSRWRICIEMSFSLT